MINKRLIIAKNPACPTGYNTGRMIDIHTHILPGMDDGAREMDEAVRICRAAALDGTTTMVATPHTMNGIYTNRADAVRAATEALSAALREQGVDVRVLPGADACMGTELLAGLKDGTVMTINDSGAFVLMELPGFFVPAHASEAVFQLKLMGMTPVITHPERNSTIIDNPELALMLIQAGALMQVTAGSVTGEFGDDIRDFTARLIKRRMVHIIASDTHNLRSRPPGLRRALRAASGLVGPNAAVRMVNETPGAIINGEMPLVEPPEPEKKTRRRSFISFFGLGKKGRGAP